MKPEEQEQLIAIWSKAVDTQMHFNEMCVKSRQLGLAFVAAALGIAVILMTKGEDFSIDIPIPALVVSIHVSAILVFAAALGLTAVKILDLNVYHKMLRGAVTFGEDFEQTYMKKIFELQMGMTQAISHFSRYSDAKAAKQADGKYMYEGLIKESAEDKIRAFYKKALQFLCGAGLAIFVITNLHNWGLTSKDSEPKSATTKSQNVVKDTVLSGPAQKVGQDHDRTGAKK